MKNIKLVLIAFLFGITIFSVFKYISTLREKYGLMDNLTQEKAKTASLESDKRGLTEKLDNENKLRVQLQQKYSFLKDNLKASNNKLIKVNIEAKRVRQLAEELNSQVSVLKAENEAVRKDSDQLKLKLSEINQENENLKVKLGSLAELKKAIGEVKKQVRKVAVGMIKKVEKEKVINGNRGFVVNNNKPTAPAKIRIEVNPATQDNPAAMESTRVNPAAQDNPPNPVNP